MTIEVKNITLTKSNFDVTVRKYDGRLQVTDPITVKNQIYEEYLYSANNALHLNGQSGSYYTNAYNISTGVLNQLRLPTTYVVPGQYGNNSLVPVITVDQYGRINSISTAAIAGIVGYGYSAANNTFAITTGDGTIFKSAITGLSNLTIDGGEY